MAKLDELKKLPPEERIRRLKEIEEEDKKELEEAKKLIAESEFEADEDQKSIREMPIPQMRAIDIDSLFSPEEKQMFREKRPSEATRRKDDDEKKPKKKEITALEDAIGGDIPRISGEQIEMQKQYIQQLATERPATDIYQGLTSLAREAHDKGYLNQEEQGRLYALYNAAFEKNRALQEGEYNANRTSAERITDALDLFKALKKNYLG